MNQAQFNALAAQFQKELDTRVKDTKGKLIPPGKLVAPQRVVDSADAMGAQYYEQMLGGKNATLIEGVRGFYDGADQVLRQVAKSEGLTYSELRYNPQDFQQP